MKTRSLGRLPKLIRKLRPSFDEVDYYARLILQHEHRPISALAMCQHEAEMQLWAMRSVRDPDDCETAVPRFASA